LPDLTYIWLSRLECYSLLLRLHHARVLQQSVFTRNILVQPGPLTQPPEKRSLETPSFRIVDFGRGKMFDEMGAHWIAYEVEWEKKQAQKELKLDL